MIAPHRQSKCSSFFLTIFLSEHPYLNAIKSPAEQQKFWDGFQWVTREMPANFEEKAAEKKQSEEEAKKLAEKLA